MQKQELEHHLNQVEDELIAFTQTLLKTPAVTGQEAAMANVIAEQLKRLNYQNVHIDKLGNITGYLKGDSSGSPVIYLSHMDHPDPGPRDNWPYDPYGAQIEDGFLLGCGASDSKGAIAAQIYAGLLLQKLGLSLPADYIFAGTVQERTFTCVGSHYLFEHTLKDILDKISLVILGNPTSLELFLGHRGRVELVIETCGRTCHSSVPWLGINAIYQLAPLLEEIQTLSANLPSHHFMEPSTLSATNINCLPGTIDRVPDRAEISIDRRFLPTESLEEVIGQFQSIIYRLSAKDPNFKARVLIKEVQVEAADISIKRQRFMPAFLTAEDSSGVTLVREALESVQDEVDLGAWRFSTDGSFIASKLGLPTLGYSPGEEKYMHTTFDRLNIEYLKRSVLGYASIYLHQVGLW